MQMAERIRRLFLRRCEFVCAKSGGAGRAVGVGGCIGFDTGADGRGVGFEAVVEDIFRAHGIVERVGVPETFYEVVVVLAGALEQAAAHGDGSAGEVAVADVAAVAVDYAVDKRSLGICSPEPSSSPVFSSALTWANCTAGPPMAEKR